MKRLKSIMIFLIPVALIAVSIIPFLPELLHGIDRGVIRMKDELLNAPVIVEGYPTGKSRNAIGPDGSTSELFVSFEVSREFKGKLRTDTIEILQNIHYPLETTLPQGSSYILFLDVYGKSDSDVYSYESNWCLYRSDETNTTPVYDNFAVIHLWLSKLEVNGSPSSLRDWLDMRVKN